ncbi:MAG: O-antigen ligase family protein [Bdellovibrionota bacterium]
MNAHRKAIGISLFLYCVATCISMAGMELFSWLTFVLVCAYTFRFRKETPLNWRELGEVVPWKTMIALFIIVVLGVVINGPADADRLMPIGKMRQLPLIVGIVLAFTLFQPQPKQIRFFAILTSIIAVYGIVQSFTGFDFIRSDGRAVQSFLANDGRVYWKSAGTFGSPMSYVYIAGLYLFLFSAWAMFLPKGRLKNICVAASLLVAASVITTYIRGAWLALAAAAFFVAMINGRKVFLGAVTVFSVAAAAAFLLFESIRSRFMTLFDPSMRSNLDRSRLWEANWEMFKDFPILGTGYTYNEDLAPDYLARIGYPEAFAGHAHNNYLQMLAGTGFLGFALYMFLCGFFLYVSFRVWKYGVANHSVDAKVIGLGTLGAQIFLHFGGLTESNFKDGETSHGVTIIWALAASTYLLSKKNALTKPKSV